MLIKQNDNESYFFHYYFKKKMVKLHLLFFYYFLNDKKSTHPSYFKLIWNDRLKSKQVDYWQPYLAIYVYDPNPDIQTCIQPKSDYLVHFIQHIHPYLIHIQTDKYKF